MCFDSGFFAAGEFRWPDLESRLLPTSGSRPTPPMSGTGDCSLVRFYFHDFCHSNGKSHGNNLSDQVRHRVRRMSFASDPAGPLRSTWSGLFFHNFCQANGKSRANNLSTRSDVGSAESDFAFDPAGGVLFHMPMEEAKSDSAGPIRHLGGRVDPAPGWEGRHGCERGHGWDCLARTLAFPRLLPSKWQKSWKQYRRPGQTSGPPDELRFSPAGGVME